MPAFSQIARLNLKLEPAFAALDHYAGSVNAGGYQVQDGDLINLQRALKAVRLADASPSDLKAIVEAAFPPIERRTRVRAAEGFSQVRPPQEVAVWAAAVQANVLRYLLELKWIDRLIGVTVNNKNLTDCSELPFEDGTGKFDCVHATHFAIRAAQDVGQGKSDPFHIERLFNICAEMGYNARMIFVGLAVERDVIITKASPNAYALYLTMQRELEA